MVENGQFNFLRANKELSAGGKWILICDKGDLSESKTPFAEALKIQTLHELIPSHHVSMEPKLD